jgi:hypothetical protein
VRLDNVTAIVDRALTTIDRNPQIVQEIASGVGSGQGAGSAVEDVGGGAQVLSKTTDEAGRTVRRVADGNGSIVEQTLTESGEVSEEAVVSEADTAGEGGEEKGVVQATSAPPPPPNAGRRSLGWTSRRQRARAPEVASPSRT